MDYFADNGKVFTTDEVVSTMARRSFVTFEPLGVIGSIMPWNFPYWQALRFAAPSLMVGNTIVLFVLKGLLHVSFTIFLD
jgi:succinate-semialdehyde dehydrogenase/glutarate-semialdehyde dehydrogenase/succinyl-CoA reductase